MYRLIHKYFLHTLGCLFSAATLLACSESDLSIEHVDPFPVPDSLIEIYSPANGSKLPANKPFILDYAVVRGMDGAYVRIRVDKLRSVKITALSGRHHIDGLPPGPHRITVKEYNSEHEPTGGKAEINVFME